MFFEGASRCCTPVSVKGTGLRRLLLSLSLRACASEAHHPAAGAPRCCGCFWLHISLLVFSVLVHIICFDFTDYPRQHASTDKL